MALKKCIALMLAVFMVLSMAACGGANPAPTTRPAASGNPDAIFPETLSIYGPLDSRILTAGGTDHNSCDSWKEIERVTGTKIEWTIPATGVDANQDLNLLITSGKLPDIIRFNWSAAPGGISQYYEDKVILRLTDLINDHMPNLNRLLTDRNIRRNLIYNEDDIFFIPEIRNEDEMNVFYGLMIRADWLEELGLSEPETIDELYDVLVAFRDNKNENGDAWAMSGIGFGPGGGWPIGNLLWAFGVTSKFYQVGGTVKYGVMEPEFAEGMAYIAKLYAEGLIDPDYSIQDRASLDGKWMNDLVGFEYGIQPTMRNRTMEGTGFICLGLNWLKKDMNSPGYCFDLNYISNMNIGNSAAITTACKEPEKAARWLDFIFSEQGAIITNYGIEGRGYTLSADGKPVATEEYINSFDAMYLYSFHTSSLFPSLRYWDTYKISLHPYGAQSIERWTKTADLSRMLPSLPFTTEEQQETNDQLADITTYVDEQISRLVTGQISVDSIPEIRDRLTQMGIQNCIDIYQRVYDRLKSN